MYLRRVSTLVALVVTCVLVSTTSDAQSLPSAVNPPVRADEGLPNPLAAPSLPEVPVAQRTNVDSLRRRMPAMQARCEQDVVDHVAHHPECTAWFDELEHAGDDGVHAIGQTLAALAVRRVEIPMRSVTRLIEVLAGSGSPTAVPYLLWYLSREIPWHAPEYGDAANWEAAFAALARITGSDLTPWPPWQSDLPSVDLSLETRWAQDASFTWLRWYRSHRNESRESWLANGLTRTRADLHSRDTARRWSAIARLWSAADEHEAAQNSLNELLAGHTLSREGRAYITRWANEHGVTQH